MISRLLRPYHGVSQTLLTVRRATTSTRRPVLTRIVVMACVCLAGLTTSCTMDSFLFSPTEVASYSLPSTAIPDSLVRAVTFTSGGQTLYGFFARQPVSKQIEPHYVVLYHHGNKYNIEHYWERVALLWQCGFSVFIYDYRGYGMSEGRLESETMLLEDAEAAWSSLVNTHMADSAQIVQYGFSLGGVPAIYLATRHQTHALVTEAAFASAEALVQSGTVLNIPGRYVMKDGFDNAGRIGNVHTKLLMLHGEEDDFIPLATHATQLYNHARQPKTLIKIPGAGHSTIPATMGEQTYMDVISAFVRGI